MPGRTIALILIACAAAMAGCSAVGLYEPRPPQQQATAQRLAAEFDAAVALVADLEYEKATAEFARLLRPLEDAGDATRTAETLFWLGYCCEKRGRRDDAGAFYDRVINEHPQAPAARQAAARLARLRPPPGG